MSTNNCSGEENVEIEKSFIPILLILSPIISLTDYSLVIAPVVADLCTTPVALSAPPNSYQNNSQS